MTDVVVEEAPGLTKVIIVARDQDSDILAGFLTADEPIALSFTGIPTQPRKNQIKENM